MYLLGIPFCCLMERNSFRTGKIRGTYQRPNKQFLRYVTRKDPLISYKLLDLGQVWKTFINLGMDHFVWDGRGNKLWKYPDIILTTETENPEYPDFRDFSSFFSLISWQSWQKLALLQISWLHPDNPDKWTPWFQPVNCLCLAIWLFVAR